MIQLENDIKKIVEVAKIPLHFHPNCTVSDLTAKKMDAILLRARRPQREITVPNGGCFIDFSARIEIWSPFVDGCKSWDAMKEEHFQYIYDKKLILDKIIWILTADKPYPFSYKKNNDFIDFTMVGHPVSENKLFGVIAELNLLHAKSQEEINLSCCNGLYFDGDALKVGRFSPNWGQ